MQASKPTLDVEYFLYQRRMEMAAQQRNTAESLIVSLVRFDKLKKKNDELWLRAATAQVRVLIGDVRIENVHVIIELVATNVSIHL